MGQLVDRLHRDLLDDEIARICGTYHGWRPHPNPLPQGEGSRRRGEGYKDVPGFCKSATTKEIAAHGYVLTPGRHVGAEEAEEDDEPFEEKMRRLTAKLEEQFIESGQLEAAIRKNLVGLGYPVKRGNTA